MLDDIDAESFPLIIDQLASIDLIQSSDFDVVVGLIFEKAVKEHAFCNLYAEMCSVLRTRYVYFLGLLCKRCAWELQNLPVCFSQSQHEMNTRSADCGIA